MRFYNEMVRRKKEEKRAKKMTITAVLLITSGIIIGLLPVYLRYTNVVKSLGWYYISFMAGLAVGFALVMLGINMIHNLYDKMVFRNKDTI